MRQVINISLPEKMAKIVKKEVKSGDYASVSEFFRYLIRERNNYKLVEDLKKDRQMFEFGKGKTLRSLRDLR